MRNKAEAPGAGAPLQRDERDIEVEVEGYERKQRSRKRRESAQVLREQISDEDLAKVARGDEGEEARLVAVATQVVHGVFSAPTISTSAGGAVAQQEVGGAVLLADDVAERIAREIVAELVQEWGRRNSPVEDTEALASSDAEMLDPVTPEDVAVTAYCDLLEVMNRSSDAEDVYGFLKTYLSSDADFQEALDAKGITTEKERVIAGYVEKFREYEVKPFLKKVHVTVKGAPNEYLERCVASADAISACMFEGMEVEDVAIAEKIWQAMGTSTERMAQHVHKDILFEKHARKCASRVADMFMERGQQEEGGRIREFVAFVVQEMKKDLPAGMLIDAGDETVFSNRTYARAQALLRTRAEEEKRA
jgi:hypothetical protein